MTEYPVKNGKTLHTGTEVKLTIVLLLDGNSEIGTHVVWSENDNLICSRYLFRSTEVANLLLALFFFLRAYRFLSYHQIQVPGASLPIKHPFCLPLLPPLLPSPLGPLFKPVFLPSPFSLSFLPFLSSVRFFPPFINNLYILL